MSVSSPAPQPPVGPAREAVAAHLGGRTPAAAIVLGSGLGGLADRIADPVRVPYADIPGFHPPAVEGHKGELVIGKLGGKLVLAQSGRFHAYEAWSADEVALPVRVFGGLGIRILILTNAAGGVRRTFAAGSVMLIADHLNLSGQNPLWGPVRPGETRFPDLTAAWDPKLRALARRVALEESVPLEEGVYAMLAGPNYETPAEVRMLERLGADAVGMSTVLEAIAARALGIRCLGFSTITNPAAGLQPTPLSHDEVMAIAERTGRALARLVEGVVRGLPERP